LGLRHLEDAERKGAERKKRCGREGKYQGERDRRRELIKIRNSVRVGEVGWDGCTGMKKKKEGGKRGKGKEKNYRGKKRAFIPKNALSYVKIIVERALRTGKVYRSIKCKERLNKKGSVH